MKELFLDKYRIGSMRKKGHDYTSPGAYFITINTDAKINWFGSVKHGEIRLSQIGKIVKEEWLKSAVIRDNILLDEYIIMPNHIHGIIIINAITVETARRAVSMRTKNIKSKYQRITLKPNSIGSIIGQFKSTCTKRIRKNGYKYFKWQPRYYEHIIKDQYDLHKVRSYIKLNPNKK